MAEKDEPSDAAGEGVPGDDTGDGGTTAGLASGNADGESDAAEEL